ncbi:rhomboid family intramembrane serine protease [Myxococcota bacterium]|nr:rhomboid family intramembrane serine protease [Myxococcota bacterium]MBU1381959.1 rhomboid family intramembrane serine protease [Myxococcota bacterium]MBU1498469.1 rhomboid family intramembrane serine protease [Myxococcota bacterium]
MNDHKPVIDSEIWDRNSFLSNNPEYSLLLSFVAYASIAWVVTLLFLYVPPVANAMRCDGNTVFYQGKLVNLVWGVFAHSSLSHYVSNMMYIGIFSALITGWFGHRVFWALLVPVAVSVHGISLLTYPPGVQLVGSSGLVFILIPFWIVMFRFATAHQSPFRKNLKTVGVALMLLWPMGFSPSTSYRTHYIGMLAGLVAGLIYGFIKRKEILRRNIEYCAQLTAGIDKKRKP